MNLFHRRLARATDNRLVILVAWWYLGSVYHLCLFLDYYIFSAFAFYLMLRYPTGIPSAVLAFAYIFTLAWSHFDLRYSSHYVREKTYVTHSIRGNIILNSLRSTLFIVIRRATQVRLFYTEDLGVMSVRSIAWSLSIWWINVFRCDVICCDSHCFLVAFARSMCGVFQHFTYSCLRIHWQVQS